MGQPNDGPLSRLSAAIQVAYHWQIRKSAALPYAPIEISIELTNRCNFKCTYCPQSVPTHLKRVGSSSITPDQVEAMITKLRAGGVRTAIIRWTLDGEPFLNRHFSEAVKIAAANGFDTHHFATNGSLATPKQLHLLNHDGQRFILTIDFCSDEGYFEKYRGTPGSWKRIHENIRNSLMDQGLWRFEFKITDISSFTINEVEERAHRFETLKTLFPESGRISFHQRMFHNAAGFLPIRPEKSARGDRYRLCPYPWSSMSIASNGDVVACCRDLERKTVLGNLLEQDLESIWNGEKYQAMRHALSSKSPPKGACSGCDMPYDASKFSCSNLVKTAIHRLLLLDLRR